VKLCVYNKEGCVTPNSGVQIWAVSVRCVAAIPSGDGCLAFDAERVLQVRMSRRVVGLRFTAGSTQD